jgi:integrase/recombinase XerC
VPQQPARAIDDEQLRSILGRARQPYVDWFKIAAYTGARCIEISNLDREHITKEEAWIHGKGRKDRLVPTHPLVWEMVQHLPAGPVAVDADGGRLDRRQISQRGNYYITHTLKIAGVTMHDLRRWFGTRTYEASGCDIRAVQELLGHAQVNTTQRYIATSAKRKAAAVAGLPLAA